MEDTPKTASLLQAIKMVLSAFIGIRKADGREVENIQVTPVQVVITGIICAAVFVFSVVTVVRWVVK